MTKAVFTCAEGSIYDDRPEERYHFPATYVREVQRAVGDWIAYYEPRRARGAGDRSGRQAYFAVARVTAVSADPRRAGYFYAYVSDYTEFDRAVPFQSGGEYMESLLRKDDGSTNRGRFGRAVRTLADADFDRILRAGFDRQLAEWEKVDQLAEPVPEYVDRPLVQRLVERKFRDAAFRFQVLAAYDSRCAISGLRLINGGGRPEVQAAHIRSVEANGPDIIRNGLALTGTVHWLFDRGLITLDDDYRIRLSPQGIPNELDRLILPSRELIRPKNALHLPHPTYLQWHREHCFKR